MRTRTIEALLLAGILICGGTALGIWIAEAFSGPSAAHRHAMEIDKSAKCASVHAGATTQQCIAGGRW